MHKCRFFARPSPPFSPPLCGFPHPPKIGWKNETEYCILLMSLRGKKNAESPIEATGGKLACFQRGELLIGIVKWQSYASAIIGLGTRLNSQRNTA